MIELIKEIIQKFGPRPAGSDAETNAQKFIVEQCKQYTDKAEFLPFEDHLDARFGKIRYYVVIFFITLAVYWLSAPVALAISAVSVTIMLLDIMMYRDVITTFPGKKRWSSNTESTLEPQGEVKSTLILSAHMDSTPEFTWWHKMGQTGVVLTVLAGVIMIFYLIFLILHAVHPTEYDSYVWITFLVFSPVTYFYWDMVGTIVVDGAQDNLSGVAISFDIFKALADKNAKGKSILKNTRIKYVTFGSEEKGLIGSRAYAKLRKDVLLKENAFLLNVDNVRVPDQLAIIGSELMSGTTHSPVLIKGLQQSFDALKVPYKMAVAPIGGSDAVSLYRVGVPGVTVIGMDAKKHDFTYHTREDMIDNVDPKALELLRNVLMDFINKWDNK